MCDTKRAETENVPNLLLLRPTPYRYNYSYYRFEANCAKKCSIELLNSINV